MITIGEAFNFFWRQHPALLYGVAATIGCSLAFGYTQEVLIVLSFMLIPAVFTRRLLYRLLIASVITTAAAAWCAHLYRLEKLPPQGIKGSGHLRICSISQQTQSFGSSWIYKGTLLSFSSEGLSAPLRQVPVSITLRDNAAVARPAADKDYLITGTLKQNRRGNYYLQVSPQESWTPLFTSHSWAEWRFQAKQWLSSSIRNQYNSSRSQNFLAGIATGDFDDRLIARDFDRFGLQHIMAISGFHFSIIASFLSLAAAAFFQRQISLVLTGAFLTAYFIFLGPTASIMRAWIMCLIAAIGLLLEKKTLGLNSLGIALLAVVLYDPMQIQSLGFQFSFAATASILLLYPTLDKLLQLAFKKRNLHETMTMSVIDQHGHILLAIIRQGIALTTAVNLTIVPLTLYYFQQFPWMSILFNLFFPFLVSLSMVLLLIGLAAGIIPVIGNTVHSINDLYTQIILNITTNTPKIFDTYLTASDIPSWIVLFVTCSIFFAGIVFREQFDESRLPAWL